MAVVAIMLVMMVMTINDLIFRFNNLCAKHNKLLVMGRPHRRTHPNKNNDCNYDHPRAMNDPNLEPMNATSPKYTSLPETVSNFVTPITMAVGRSDVSKIM